MTEIPEHLLKRSRERRAALTGEPVAADAPSAAPTAAASAPVAATPAAPAAPKAPAAPAAPPPPKPDIPVVAAAKARKKVPYWAMTTLVLLPLWGFMYARALTPQPKRATGALAVGAATYAKCESCHGGGGEGGSGRPLSGGEVLKTFPRIEDQMNFVEWGSQGYDNAGISQYGNPAREGGAHSVFSFNGTPMPSWGTRAGGELSDAEILAVVCHERYDLSGGKEDTAEFAKWCAPDSELFAGLEDGTLTFESPELKDVGPVARPSLADQNPPAAAAAAG